MPTAAEYLPHTGPIVTRAEALGAGLNRYFTGKPCKHGHVAERYTNKNCVVCVTARAAAWRGANRERFDEVARAWQKANKEHVAAKRAAWHAANREQRRLTNKAWRLREENIKRAKTLKLVWLAANKLRTRCYTENRRVRKLANGGSHTPEQIEELYAKQRQRCVGCGASIRKRYHVDHILPLTRGGPNDIGNIQLLCATCNLNKGHSDPIEWAQKKGRLL